MTCVALAHSTRRAALLFAVAAVLTMGAPAAAQVTGSVAGRIIDADTKQPLPGATVQIRGLSLGAAARLDGRFTVERVPEGLHVLEVKYLGYRTHLESDVRVVRGKAATVEEIELSTTRLSVGDVTVSQRAAEELEPLSASANVLSREEIRRSPGAAGGVLRAVSSLPGVSASDGEFSAFAVRGGGTSDNLILIDNIPFDKVSHFEGGSDEQEAAGGRFSVFTGGLIEDAYFSAGGFGVQYGRKGASVLDLKIKEGSTEGPRADASYDLLGWEVNYDGPSYLAGNTSFVLNARRFDVSRPLKLIGRGDYGVPIMSDLIAKTTTFLGSRHKVSALGLYSSDSFVRSVDNVLEAGDLVENDLWTIDEARVLGGVNWRWLTSERSFLHTTAYVRANRRERRTGDVAAIGGGLEVPETAAGLVVRDGILRQDEDEDEVGVRAAFSHVSDGSGTLNVGGEVYRIGLNYRQQLGAADTVYVFAPDDPRPEGQQFLVITPKQADYLTDNASVHGAAYLSYAWGRGRLSVEPGLRYTYNGFSGDSYLAPRVQATYRIDPRTSLNAAAGAYYQQPLYPIVVLDPANQSLANERSLHAILGVSRQVGPDLRLTVETYYKGLSDLAVRQDRTSNVFTSRGTGWAAGVDAILIKRFTDRYYGQLTYSFAAAERDDDDGRGSYPAPTLQPHIFNVIAGMEITDNLLVSGKWKYAVGRPRDTYTVYSDVHGPDGPLRFSQEVLERNGGRLRDFHLLNLRVDYRWQFRRLGVVTFLDLYNVYGRINPTESRFSELAGVERDIGFGVVAASGVKLEL